MAPAFSKVAFRNLTIVGSSLLVAYYLGLRTLKRRQKINTVDEVALEYKEKQADGAAKNKPKLNPHFLRHLRSIMKHLIPGIFSYEMALLVALSTALVGRTFGDISIISSSTFIERSIMSRDYDNYMGGLEKFILLMPFLGFVNSFIKFSMQELVHCFRYQLSQHLFSHYLKGMVFYKLSSQQSGTTVQNPEHVLTQEVDKFCQALVRCYTNIFKPILDLVLCTRDLVSTIGVAGPGLLAGYLGLVGYLLTRIRKPISRMISKEQQLEGELGYVCSRLIMNSEEIAFYRGNEKEKVTITNTLWRLMRHLRHSNFFNFCYGFIQNNLAKYWALLLGFLIISRPFFKPQSAGYTSGQRIQLYITTGKLMMKLSEAMGRLVGAGHDISRLAGYTTRLATTMEELKALQLTQGGEGKIVIEEDVIRFEKVPLVTPTGHTLVNSISFEVPAGTNVLIAGPNGSGKSSLFRILGELWPVSAGVVTKPHHSKLFYIPQKPYMALGKLRDQVIYPDVVLRPGMTDSDLEEILELVKLSYLLERDSWDSIQNWAEKLSGGEKQRIAMARLFYHQPRFAILDECTSAVSLDVEGLLYTHCRQVGITLFTVSHRKSLWKYHEYVMQLDGLGGYSFTKMDPADLQ